MKWCRLEGGEGLSDVGPLRDVNGKEICLRNLDAVRGKGCLNKHCPKSHNPAHINISDLKRSGACLEKEGLYHCLCDTHSSTFLWQNERFIEELFQRMSLKRHMTVRHVRVVLKCNGNLAVMCPK